MPPNLRSVVAQGWRSIGSRRNFSSSPRLRSLISRQLAHMKAGVVPSFKTFHITAWMLPGNLIYNAIELYKYNKTHQKLEDLCRDDPSCESCKILFKLLKDTKSH